MHEKLVVQPKIALTSKTKLFAFDKTLHISNIYLLKTPPSNDALRHSGGDNRRCTSATVTLYFDVELRSERRPGTEQNTSVGAPPDSDDVIINCFPFSILGRIPVKINYAI